jgi:hypothetical protein
MCSVHDTVKYTVKNERYSSPSGNTGMSLIKLFLAGKTYASGFFSQNQERKIPGNPEIPKVFLQQGRG